MNIRLTDHQEAMILLVAMVCILVGCVLFAWWYKRRRQMTSTQSSTRKMRRLHKGKPIGLRLGPITTNFILRPVLSLAAGMVVAWLLYRFAIFVGSTIFPAWAAMTLGGLLTVFFSLNDNEPLVVPKVHVAIFTFLGVRFRIYFKEGNHYWYGAKIGFNRSTDPLPNAQTEEEEKGFVFVGKRQLEIFERALSGDRGLILKNVAFDFSEVTAKLTVVIQTMDPLSWANSTDPILDAAERARSALRTSISYFTGVDNAIIKGSFNKLLGGQKLLAAFIEEPVKDHARGSIIQHRSGNPIYEIVSPNLSARKLKKKKEKLCRRIEREANPDMLAKLPRDNGNIIIQEREVVDHLVTVMDAIGAHFDHASVSDFSLSEEVRKQANKAAGENLQRVAQLLSADTTKKVRDILAIDADKPGAEAALMAALAEDGLAKIVFVPGADRLTRAAVAGANQIGDGK